MPCIRCISIHDYLLLKIEIMTPKQKAIVLIDMFFEYTNDVDKYEYAKKCAIKTVDEILKVIHTNMEEKYWQEVKHEIEKL